MVTGLWHPPSNSRQLTKYLGTVGNAMPLSIDRGTTIKTLALINPHQQTLKILSKLAWQFKSYLTFMLHGRTYVHLHLPLPHSSMGEFILLPFQSLRLLTVHTLSGLRRTILGN